LAFSFFSRADRRICLYWSISSFSVAPQDAIISSKSFAAALHACQFRLPATPLRGNVETKDFAVARNRQRLVRFEVTRKLFAEFTYANFDMVRIAIPGRLPG